MNRLAPRCEELDHHPDLSIRWRWVDVVLSTHSAGGVTDKDLTLAGIVDEVAAGLPLALTHRDVRLLAAPFAHAERDQAQLARRRARGSRLP